MRRGLVLTALAALLAGAPAASATRPATEPLRERAGGFLTAPSQGRPATVALDYVRDRPARFGLDESDLDGLRLARSYRSAGGLVHLQWEQYHRGIPVFGPGLRANVDADGRLLNVGEGARPDPAVPSLEPRLSALDALLAAGRAAGIAVVPGSPGTPSGRERLTRFGDGQGAHLTVFGDQLAWRVRVRGDDRRFYDAVVDADSGETLYRVNMVREATASVFDNYPGAPLGGQQVSRPLPAGWITDPTRLDGANAQVYTDPDDDTSTFSADPSQQIPPQTADNWSWGHDARPAAVGQFCPALGCTWEPGNSTFGPGVNLNQAGTQLFWYVNAYHDHLRDSPGIGFGPSSGNFEGGDRVIGQVDDGSGTGPDCDHTNNAFVMPAAEGTPLLMSVYLWTNGCPPYGQLRDVNAADDAMIIYHEYTHGMTNRLVTLADGSPGMNGYQAGAMDEGFADWYALDRLNAQGLEPDGAAPGELRLGKYENDKLRTQPFDCPVGAAAAACPGSGLAGSGGYTYGDFARILGGAEVHADGEIWVETLWDLRNSLIAGHGRADGITRARALVTDGLRLAPANPTFLDMRNAILQSDLTRGFGDRNRIWSVFAARGMGYRASTRGTNDAAPLQDFSLPPAPPAPPPRDTSRPRVTRFTMSSKRFKVGRISSFKFRISEPGRAVITIERSDPGRRVRGRCRPDKRSLRNRPRCTRHVKAASIRRSFPVAGAQQVRWRGKRRGSYRATITVTDAAGNRSRSARVSFKIIRR